MSIEMTKLIMNGTTDERLMTIGDLSEMLGIPIETLYGWRHRGEVPQGYRWGDTFATVDQLWRRGSKARPIEDISGH